MERTDGLGYASMILNQNREHAIKVRECTKRDHILCCLNQGKFKGEHGLLTPVALEARDLIRAVSGILRWSP